MISKFVSGYEKFLVTGLGVLQTLLAADTFGLPVDVNRALIGFIVPLQGWLTANTTTFPDVPEA